HTLGAGGVINGQFYVAGGRSSNVLDRYDPASNSWKTLAPLPVGGGGSGQVRGTAMQGKLYVVVDNFNSSGTEVFDAFAYDPATNKWTRKAAPKFSHSDIVAVTLNGKPHQVAVGGGGIKLGGGAGRNPAELYTP